jgi:hypothetical protein
MKPADAPSGFRHDADSQAAEGRSPGSAGFGLRIGRGQAPSSPRHPFPPGRMSSRARLILARTGHGRNPPTTADMPTHAAWTGIPNAPAVKGASMHWNDFARNQPVSEEVKSIRAKGFAAFRPNTRAQVMNHALSRGEPVRAASHRWRSQLDASPRKSCPGRSHSPRLGSASSKQG